MAKANPSNIGNIEEPKEVKLEGSKEKPTVIKSWNEMVDPDTGKKRKGHFKLGNTVITNN